MGWRFRRSVKLGPLSINLSKSGVGYSIGGRGFRVGKDAKGRSYTSASIPGTGLYSRTYASRSNSPLETGVPATGATAPQQRGGNSLGLVVAFFAGIALTLFLVALFSSSPTPPPVTPPAAVSGDVAPPQPTPAKRRRTHRAQRLTARPQDQAAPRAQPQQAP